MHSEDDLDFERGYEWWLMVEAKKRNPDILLYGLSWAFPGWVGGGSTSPFAHPNLTATYVRVCVLYSCKQIHYKLGSRREYCLWSQH
jgi:galactosylceramidase